MPSVSVITPAIGRESLGVMLGHLVPQLAPGDEALVIGDGPQPVSARIASQQNSPYVRYWDHPPVFNYGNPQRNAAIIEARGDYLLFVDDDDDVLPECLSTLKQVAAQHPGRPLMFKMKHLNRILWNSPSVGLGNVSGQMFVTPNVEGRVGKWSGKYAADFDFINSTLALYPEGEAAVVWREEILVIQGYVGPRKVVKELP
jgi:glycosyltransferase involved in cell wall biosynthesis